MLNRLGYTTASKKGRRAFSKDTVCVMLKNKFYLGLVSYKGEWFPGKHAPLVDQDVFDRAMAARHRRTAQQVKANHETRVYPLSQLLYCEECGLRYRGFNHPRRGRSYWKPITDYGVSCSQRSTVWEDVEEDLADVLSRMQLPKDWQERILTEMKYDLQKPKEIERQRAQLHERLRRAESLFLMGDWTEAQYRQAKAEMQFQLAALKPVQMPNLNQAAELLTTFGKLYRIASDDQKKRLFHTVLERVYLRSDEISALLPKAEFYPLMLVHAGGPDGIRTRDLGLDRAACLAATPRVQVARREYTTSHRGASILSSLTLRGMPLPQCPRPPP